MVDDSHPQPVEKTKLIDLCVPRSLHSSVDDAATTLHAGIHIITLHHTKKQSLYKWTHEAEIRGRLLKSPTGGTWASAEFSRSGELTGKIGNPKFQSMESDIYIYIYISI